MRYLFTFVFLSFILGSVLTEKIPRYKLARLGLALRKIKMHRDEIRKLQTTTDEDEYVTDDAIAPTYSPNSTSTDANSPDNTIPEDSPVSTQGFEVDQKDAGIQIMLFHNYNYKPRQRTIGFSIFFFFYYNPIPRYIIIRIRVIYRYRLRNLDGETDTSDSLRTLCSLKATQLAGKNYTEGKTVDYECDATASRDISDGKVNIALDTDFDMITVDKDGNMESVNFKEINFNANSTAESSNIQDNLLVIDDNKVSINYLRNGSIIPSEKNILRIKGKNKNDLGAELENGEEVRMILKTSNRRGEKIPEQYNCRLNRSTEDLIMDCDISSKSINTSNKDLHLSISNDTQQVLTLQMRDYNDTTPIILSSSNTIKYRQNSGGLSGGAIAGIVIACIVVLAAASIAAILLRRPKAPLDNTTVVGLKTVDNL